MPRPNGSLTAGMLILAGAANGFSDVLYPVIDFKYLKYHNQSSICGKFVQF